MNERRRRRGMTLIELMVALAIALIFISAAMVVFAGVTQRNTDTGRWVEREGDTALATMLIQRDLVNAGFRFPSARYSVQSYDNVTGATVISNSASTAEPISSGAGTTGIMEGTDVVEILLGSPVHGRGVITNAPTAGSTTPSVVLQDNEPFLAGGETPADGAVLLFAGQPSGLPVSCLAHTASAPAGTPVTLSTNILEPNLRVAGAGVTNCPQNGFGVYRMGSRVRYFVGWDSTLQRSALYVQRGGEAGLMGAAEALVWGVEDLQLAPMVLNDAADALGCGAGQVCECNTGGACTVGPTTTMDSGLPWTTQQVGLQIGLSTPGERRATAAGGRRPALFNRAAGAVDDRVRSVRFTTIWFRNLTMVAP